MRRHQGNHSKAAALFMVAAWALVACVNDPATPDEDTRPAAIEFIEHDEGFTTASSYGGLIWTSGHLPITESGNIVAQTTEVMEVLQDTLEEAGGGFDTVVTNAYLANFDDWDAFNEVYISYFDGKSPPRVTVEVSSLAFGLLIEISMVAHVRNE